MLTKKQREAIEITERILRQIGGKHVIVQLTADGCELEDTSWAGSSCGKTLLECILDTLEG